MPDEHNDPIPYRLRAREGLLTYPFAGSIPLHACRTDKMEIRLRGTMTYIDEEQLCGLLYLMSSTRMPQSGPGLLTAPSAGGWKQSIRADIWHFNGPVAYRNHRETSCTVIFDLTINPTRFAEHCWRQFNPITIDDLRRIPTQELLRVRQGVSTAAKSATLTDSDNMLTSSPWLTHVSRNWSVFVEFYVDSIRGLIEGSINDYMRYANDVGDPPVLRIDRPTGASLNIGYVEQHVEFCVHDARGELVRITDRLRLMASDLSETSAVSNILVGRENSATWVSIRLRANLNLKCYAKAEGRVRVEVEYGGRSAHGRSIGTLVASGLWPSRGTLAQKINALQVDAARRIDHVVRSLGPVPERGERLPSGAMTELVDVLASGRFVDQAAWRFLKSLLSEAVVRGRRNSQMAKIGEAMTRRGIMVRSTLVGRGRLRCYLPSVSLAAALARLHEEPQETG